jgi:hypothetical protein
MQIEPVIGAVCDSCNTTFPLPSTNPYQKTYASCQTLQKGMAEMISLWREANEMSDEEKLAAGRTHRDVFRIFSTFCEDLIQGDRTALFILGNIMGTIQATFEEEAAPDPATLLTIYLETILTLRIRGLGGSSLVKFWEQFETTVEMIDALRSEHVGFMAWIENQYLPQC